MGGRHGRRAAPSGRIGEQVSAEVEQLNGGTIRTLPPLPLGLIRDPENPALTVHLRKLEEWDFAQFSQSIAQRPGWSTKRVAAAEKAIKWFLALAFLDPGHFHVPPPDADQFWHLMILQTPWYRRFCDDFFGFYFDHFLEPNSALCNERRKRTARALEYWFGPGARFRRTGAKSNGNQGGGTFADLAPAPRAQMK